MLRSAGSDCRDACCFAGLQGKGGRTHLMSPKMAAAAAITGHLVDVRELEVPTQEGLPEARSKEGTRTRTLASDTETVELAPGP